MASTDNDYEGCLQRKQYLSLLAPYISLKELQGKYKLKVSGKQYTKAREHAKLHGPGTSTKINPPPKSSLHPKISDLISKHAFENSRPAANQTRKVKGEHVPAMIKLSNDKLMYQDFVKTLSEERKIDESLPEKISKSSYLKKLPKNFIKPKKTIDYCSICDSGRLAANRILPFVKRIHKNCEIAREVEGVHINGLLGSFGPAEKWTKLLCQRVHSCLCQNIDVREEDKEQENEMVEGIKTIKIVLNHREENEKQKKAFNADVQNLRYDTAIIVADYKEKVKICPSDLGPVQRGEAYYDQLIRSFLGATIITKNEEDRKCQEHTNYLSKILSQDSEFSSDCCEKVLHNLCSESQHLKKVKFWFDCGNHFRSKEIIHDFLINFQNQFRIKIEINFFC